MRALAFKHAIAAAVATIGLLAAVATAQAAQIDPTGPWTAATGAVSAEIVPGFDVTCAVATSAGAFNAPVPAGGAVPVNRTFAGCVGTGGIPATHVCAPWRFEVQAFPTPTTVLGAWVIPAGACTITLPGCTISYASPGIWHSGPVATLDTVTQDITWPPLHVPFTAVGPGCANHGVPPAGILVVGSAPAPPGVASDVRTGGAPWTTS